MGQFPSQEFRATLARAQELAATILDRVADDAFSSDLDSDHTPPKPSTGMLGKIAGWFGGSHSTPDPDAGAGAGTAAVATHIPRSPKWEAGPSHQLVLKSLICPEHRDVVKEGNAVTMMGRHLHIINRADIPAGTDAWEVKAVHGLQVELAQLLDVSTADSSHHTQAAAKSQAKAAAAKQAKADAKAAAAAAAAAEEAAAEAAAAAAAEEAAAAAAAAAAAEEAAAAELERQLQEARKRGRAALVRAAGLGDSMAGLGSDSVAGRVAARRRPLPAAEAVPVVREDVPVVRGAAPPLPHKVAPAPTTVNEFHEQGTPVAICASAIKGGVVEEGSIVVIAASNGAKSPHDVPVYVYNGADTHTLKERAEKGFKFRVTNINGNMVTITGV